MADVVEFVHEDLFRVPVFGAHIVYCCCATWPPAIMSRLATKLAAELEDGSKVLTVGNYMPATVTLPEVGVVRFAEVWNGLAQCAWGQEVLVVHEVRSVSARAGAGLRRDKMEQWYASAANPQESWPPRPARC